MFRFIEDQSYSLANSIVKSGAETGLSSTSEDGLSSANIRFVMDRVGTRNRSSFALNFDRSF